VKRAFTAERDRARLDQLVADAAGCSRAEARRLIDAGLVRVGGRTAKKGLLVPAGARVELEREPPREDQRRPVPQPELPLELLCEDATLVAVNKPAGMPTHPLRPDERGTLANALVGRFPECAQVADDAREGGVAHRLDVDTSGVLLAARTREGWLALRRAFSSGLVDKQYLALCSGTPPDQGEIRAALAHRGRTMRAVSEWDDEVSAGARAALTRFETLARGDGVALVRASSTTGRMHQIRAHLAHAGHPLCGDPLYGGPPAAPDAPGHFLHAAAITFPHPATGARTTVIAPLPATRRAALTRVLGPLPPGID